MTTAVPPLPRQATSSQTPDERTWTVSAPRPDRSPVPPGQALPDRQPEYVASWIYVFGVLTLAALLVVLVSGWLLALGGAPGGTSRRSGHFVNSLHLWSVELFFAFMVIHLWGKFWMAAWRGRRTLTWVTGVVAFVASIGTAFTGYLSQSNFDSQWISARGQGRPQLDRRRRVVQRAEPRPDAAVARRAAAVRGRRDHRRCTSCWCAATASCRPSTHEDGE